LNTYFLTKLPVIVLCFLNLIQYNSLKQMYG
jgi:hypothetical protein